MTTASLPFLPQDVFRLVVRLETHRALGDVDVGALERTFRVPLGYSDEDLQLQREKLGRNNVPGPGAYDVVDPWRLDDDVDTHGSAAFASRTERDPYQLPPSPSRNRAATTVSGVSKQHSSSDCSGRRALDPALPLGTFSRCPRGLDRKSASRLQSHRRSLRGSESVRPTAVETATAVPSLLSSQSAVFSRVAKDRESFVLASDPAIAPGTYDVRRLWDDAPNTTAVPHSQRRLHTDKPSAAIFGASREKREVMWSPARTAPSCAKSEAWNASPHYAKQKRRVLRAAEREKREQRLAADAELLAQSAPAPVSLTRRRGSTTASCYNCSGGTGDADPFEWLRRQPQSEHRAHALAVKYGLLEHAKVHSLSHGAISGGSNALTAISASTSTGVGDDEVCSTASHALASQRSQSDLYTQQQQQQQQQQVTASAPQRISDGGNTSDLDQSHCNDDDKSDELARSAKDARIEVSCRLPGGMMVSATLFSRKRVRHLKACIVQRQTRFTHDEQFDLFLPNGRKLAQLDATLLACGLTSRSLVQIVPCATPLPVHPLPHAKATHSESRSVAAVATPTEPT